MCLVFCYQKHLSLRTQVVNPLVLVFIVLASTAALVGVCWGCKGWRRPAWAGHVVLRLSMGVVC